MNTITSDLIRAAAAGDDAACTRLFEIAAPPVFRMAYQLLLHREDSEDVLQEVFVYVFRNLRSYDPARGSFKTWVYTITVSRCRNARRRKFPTFVDLGQLAQVGLEPPSQEESPEQAAIRGEANQVLTQALGSLSPALREAVVLRYGHQLAYREMSAVLNCPEKTAESRVRLARAALRKAMTARDIAVLDQLLPT